MSGHQIRAKAERKNPRHFTIKPQTKRHVLARGRHRGCNDLGNKAADCLVRFAFLIGPVPVLFRSFMCSC